MIKGIFLLHGFLFVILVLIQSTNGENLLKACFGGICGPKQDKYKRDESPIRHRPNIEYIPPSIQKSKKPVAVIIKPDPVIVNPPVGNKTTGRSSVKKAESKSPPESPKSSTASDGHQSGEKSPIGMSKSALKKREAAKSENILADLEVQVAAKGKSTRTAKEAEIFKAAVEEKLKGNGLSDTFVLTGESCANGMGNLYKKLLWNKEVIYEVCFNDLTSTAIYTTHTSKPFEEKTKTDRNKMDTKWRASYLLSLWNVDSYYTKKAQKAEFDRIYGENQEYVTIDGSNWYAHAHLTPHGDFIEEEEQLSTYEQHNCVAGKQSVNNGNWKRIENYGRGLIRDYNTNILVYTGVHEQLELKVNSTGKLAKAWLNEEDHRLAVPKIHFKLYINPANNHSVAFFTSNDPDMDDAEQKKFRSMCDDICNDINFEPKNDVQRGITICCTYRQFSNHITFLPKMLPVKSELFKRTMRETSPRKSRSPTERSSVKKAENKSPPESPKSSTASNEHQSGVGSPTGMSKSASKQSPETSPRKTHSRSPSPPRRL